MQKTKNIILAVLLIKLCSFGYSQTVQEWVELKKEPQKNEIVLGNITYLDDLYTTYDEYDYVKGKLTFIRHGRDDNGIQTDEQILEKLNKEANEKFGQKYPRYYLRNFTKTDTILTDQDYEYTKHLRTYCNVFKAKVVIKDPKVEANEKLRQAIIKSLANIREGSRLAIDQVRIAEGDKEDFKDQIVEILLDEGFKVVAKEYLDRLYEEQQAQQSGIYNDRTTVQENNFSAVGYYINVKRTDSSIKVQIINVSTGEYEANTSVNLD